MLCKQGFRDSSPLACLKSSGQSIDRTLGNKLAICRFEILCKLDISIRDEMPDVPCCEIHLDRRIDVLPSRMMVRNITARSDFTYETDRISKVLKFVLAK